MTASILALVGGVLSFAFQLWMDYQRNAPARKAKKDALVQRSLRELRAATDRVRGNAPVPPKRRNGQS